jgi:hypothetical protein
MKSMIQRARKGFLGVAVAAGLTGAMLPAQATGLWGDVQTFLDQACLNGAEVFVDYNGTAKHVYAGQVCTRFGESDPFVAFCTDLLNPLQGGWFECIDPMPAVNEQTNPRWASGGGERAAMLYNGFAGSLGGLPGCDQIGAGTAAGDIAAAALQVAIWEALYDETPGLNNGLFQMLPNGSALQDAILCQAAIYLTLLSPVDPEQGLMMPLADPVAVWWKPLNEDGSLRQAQGLIGTASIVGPAVPAPTDFGAATLLVGLLGLWLRRRPTV